MYEFHQDIDAIDVAFQEDLEDIFTKWAHSGSTSFSKQDPPNSRRDVSLAANWISLNYHNPYPSHVVRDDISRRASWNRKDVDAWFTEARKRIGWNEIRKKYFNNKRADTVEKATRFFRSHDKPCDPSLAHAFINMELSVQELYVEPFERTKLSRASGSSGKQDDPSLTTKGFYSVATHRGSPTLSSLGVYPPSPISPSASPIQQNNKRSRFEEPVEDDAVNVMPSKKARQERREPPFRVAHQTQLLSPATSQSELSDHASEVTLKPYSRTGNQQSSSLTSPMNSKENQSNSQSSESHQLSFNSTRSLDLPTVPTPAVPLRSLPSAPRTSPPTTDVFPDLATSLSDTQGTPIDIPAPSTQPSSTSLSPSQNKTPCFSFEMPPPASCHQPMATHSIELALFPPRYSQDRSDFLSFNDGNDIYTTAALFGNDPQAMPPTEQMDMTSLFQGSLCDDQYFDLPADNASSILVNSLRDFGQVNVNLEPSLNLDAHIPEPLSDDVLSDFLRTFSVPSATDTEKANHLAHLEMLKQQKDHIQERIRILEHQISGYA
ncbi:Mating-type protein beta1-1 [Leucoagaricus sp. SymC.cos]|nr:Mating-type protein beta1-1 [Leucoagaricus sp. SymC.cos]